MMLAAYHGHADAVRALVARGAAAGGVNDRGQTPLAGAVFKGSTDVIKALLEGGADPAEGTPSALDTARMFGRAELLELFGAH
ncbi:ankyrin repeat protein [Streptomyces sp. SAI-127]|nr:ankyrin repeat protein [Streptomyces sp. SAI-127]